LIESVLGAGFFLFGLVFGSFLNVVIHRLPLGLSVVRPRSACPGCRQPIRAYDNIPVVSWLILGGKCRDCGMPISARYATVELLTGLLFLLSFVLFGVSWMALKMVIFSFLLMGLIFIDAEQRLLPDALTLPGLVLGLIFTQLVYTHGPAGIFLEGEMGRIPPALFVRAVSLANAVVGALLGAGLLWFVGWGYKMVRGVEGMGLGDVKLMAMVGAFLGVYATLFTIMAAALAGSLAGVVAMAALWRKRVRRYRGRHPQPNARAWRSAKIMYRHYEMPFGVFLGCAALFFGLAGDKLLPY